MLNTEMAMRCDAKSLAMRLLAAEILCDAPPRCENTSDAMPRCRPLSSHALSILSVDDLGDLCGILSKPPRIVAGQNVQSMRAKRSDPLKD